MSEPRFYDAPDRRLLTETKFGSSLHFSSALSAALDFSKTFSFDFHLSGIYDQKFHASSAGFPAKPTRRKV